MKKLLFVFLFLVCSAAQAQQSAFFVPLVVQSDSALKANHQITDLAFATTQNDTTYPVNIQRFSTIVLSMHARDTTTFLIYYRMRMDTSWSKFWLKDSLSLQAADTAAAAFKTVDLSTALKGMKEVQFNFVVSQNAFARGTRDTTYSAALKVKE